MFWLTRKAAGLSGIIEPLYPHCSPLKPRDAVPLNHSIYKIAYIKMIFVVVTEETGNH